MNTPTNQQLLGYLLDALDPAERAEVEERLARDECLRADLEVLRNGLRPLSADVVPDPPPAELARRTCDLVLIRSHALANDIAPPASARWSLADVVAAAAVVLTATLLMLPAVNVSRANAQRAGCQNNLRELGGGIARFSELRHGALPQMAALRDVSFCGIIDPELFHGGFVSDARAFVCPATVTAPASEFRMPGRDELLAEGARHGSGIRPLDLGSFAITLGHMEEGRFARTRNRGRSSFAIVADAPSMHLSEHRSANHGGKGQNVLYEDGHVRFLTACLVVDGGDDVYRNDEGFIAPGLHADDAVIAPTMLFNTAERAR